MPEFLYRFRSLNSLLGKRQELENQEIFFAAPYQLNDPIEGFKDIFWCGDEIVWKNLLKHYLLCLERVCTLLILSRETDEIRALDIPVFNTERDLPTEKYKESFKAICKKFFENKATAQYANMLSLLKRPVRRDELIWHLRQLHCYALCSIFTYYENQRFIRKSDGNIPFRKLIEKILIDPQTRKGFNKIIQNPSVDGKISDQIWATINNFHYQLHLINKYNQASTPLPQNKEMVFFLFPEHYVRELEKIVHPNWFTACFLVNINNPAIWGHYGDRHRGVCLKFKPRSLNGKPIIKLKGVESQSARSRKEVSFQFHKVTYSKDYPQIDFFRSLGRLPIPALQSFWYKNEFGEESICSDEIFRNEDRWRKKYWEDFYGGITTKLNDWSYEDEYRLILSEVATDFTLEEHRKYQYSLDDLDGIIFGINTPIEDKMRIFKIIEDKCRKNGRDRFKFYQAFYSRGESQISIFEMNLLKFK